MTKKQKEQHEKLTRWIHTSKKWVEYYRHDRDAYEEVLYAAFGVRSSMGLTIGQKSQLLDFLNGKKDLPKRDSATTKQMYRISQQWDLKARSKETEAKLAFCARIAGHPVLSLSDLTKSDAQKVLVALERMG